MLYTVIPKVYITNTEVNSSVFTCHTLNPKTKSVSSVMNRSSSIIATPAVKEHVRQTHDYQPCLSVNNYRYQVVHGSSVAGLSTTLNATMFTGQD